MPLVEKPKRTTPPHHCQNEVGRQRQAYIGYFQSQLAKVPNCDEDTSVHHQIADLSPLVQAPAEAQRHADE